MSGAGIRVGRRLASVCAALAACAGPLGAQPPRPQTPAPPAGGLQVVVLERLEPLQGCAAYFLAVRAPEGPAAEEWALPGSWLDPSEPFFVCVLRGRGLPTSERDRPAPVPAPERDRAGPFPVPETGYEAGARLEIWIEAVSLPTNPPRLTAVRAVRLETEGRADSLVLRLPSPDDAGPQEAVALFNGRDLTGWRVHGTERWYVEDGELVCESGPDAGYGYLATERSYRDFVLTLEFKQEADGNSGVFFRSNLEGTRIEGWQVEVAPPGLHTGGIYESYGRGWLVRPDPALDEALRMGEWNELRVEVVGDRVRTWLNGVAMVDLVDEAIGRADGVIALQIHDGGGIKVRWRDLRIVALEATG